MARLYKFRSGRIVNLDQICCVSQGPFEVQNLARYASIHFDGHFNMLITKEEYDELVEKCEGYVSWSTSVH